MQPLTLLVCVLLLAGCASAPRAAPLPRTNEAGRITSHVGFLARPSLKGRKPGTRGSRIARHCIEGKFLESGLVPWGKKKGFEWSFGYGNNVVGFLPGSDPVLSNEVVLVSAHYDHLGKDPKGRICPGAADNASGVAALLELARQLKLDQQRPKRSIVFAAFDCEEMMLFGSFAFSCQKEVQQARIVAVINIDMLGRDLLDVVQHTLFVAGSERYPSIRENICVAGLREGIRVLPLGTDLIGPRGDHVAFESRGVPCLFFSCGTFRDYHAPGDTDEKLNYQDIARSADVIRDTVSRIADAATIEQAEPLESGFASELRTVCAVMEEVNQNRAKAGIQAEDAAAFARLTAEAQSLSCSNKYDRHMRQRLILGASGILAPYFLPSEMMGRGQSEEQLKEMRVFLPYLQELYLKHGAEMMDGYRQLVAQLLKYHPNLMRGMPLFHYEFYEIADEDICFAKERSEFFKLNALANSLSLSAQVKSSKLLLKSFSGYISTGLEPLDCEGTHQQIADYCWLTLRGESNLQHAAELRKVLRVIGVNAEDTYKEWLAERLRQSGFTDETDWIVACALEGTPELTICAFDQVKGNSDQRVRKAVCQILGEHSRRADVRASAIGLAGALKSQDALFALCAVLCDPAPAYQRDFLAMTRPGYPFADQMVVHAGLAAFDNQFKRSPSKTLGELAHAQLKKLAGRDFGNDSARWRQWVEAQVDRRKPKQ